MDEDYFEEIDLDDDNLFDENLNIDDLEDLDDEPEAIPAPNTRRGKRPKKERVKKERVKKEKEKKIKVKRRKKPFSSRTALGLGCIVAALLIFFVIEPVMTGVVGNTREIVRVRTTIYAGQKITEEMIEKVQVNGGSIPANALIKADEIVGKFTDSKLVAGDYFMGDKLKDSAFGDGIYMNGLDGTKKIISIAVPDFSAGLSGKIQAGDVISILSSSADGSIRGTSYPELKYVKVLAVTLSNGIDGTQNTDGTTALPESVTLLVNETQAQMITGLNESGTAHIILAYRGEEETANQFLEEQDRWFITNNIK